MEQIKIEQFLQESQALIYKALKKSSVCMCSGCKNIAINSHVLQNKNILKPIAPDDHLFCFEPNSLFNKEQRFTYKRKGINNVLTYSGFCSYHDDQIFSFIEKTDVDWFNPKSQFLLGYRSLCRELYVKQFSIKYYSALLDKFVLPIDMEHRINMSILGILKGIEDIQRYKEFLEMAIFNESYESYNFETIILPFCIELCVSSPISVSYSEDIANKDLVEADFIETNIVNVFPYKGKSIVIIGFANGFGNQWAKEFTRKLKTQEIELICKALSDLILFRAEFHCMSEKLYQSIHQEEIKEFLKTSEEILLLRSNNLSTKLNIFHSFLETLY